LSHSKPLPVPGAPLPLSAEKSKPFGLIFGDPRNVDALHFPMVLAAMETDARQTRPFLWKKNSKIRGVEHGFTILKWGHIDILVSIQYNSQ